MKESGTLYVPTESVEAYKQAFGWKDAFQILPIQEITGITLEVEDLELTVGDSETIGVTITPSNVTYPDITWTSSDAAVATVATDGTVTAVAPGTAIITATCGSVSATCKVTVLPIVATSITITPNPVSLVEGTTVQLNAEVYPADVTDKTVTWSSSNTEVATVDAAGLVTGVSTGKATVTAKCGEVSATVEVTVTADPAGLESVMADPNAIFDVYTIGGSVVRRGANANALRDLQPGIYVIVSGGKAFKVRL